MFFLIYKAFFLSFFSRIPRLFFLMLNFLNANDCLYNTLDPNGYPNGVGCLVNNGEETKRLQKKYMVLDTVVSFSQFAEAAAEALGWKILKGKRVTTTRKELHIIVHPLCK